MANTVIKPDSTNFALDDPGTGSLSPIAGSSASAGARSKTADSPWRNRIVAYNDAVPLERLVPHPANWRLHGSAQHAALSGVLGEVGLVASAVVNQRTQHILDGDRSLRDAVARQLVSVCLDERPAAREEAAVVTEGAHPDEHPTVGTEGTIVSVASGAAALIIARRCSSAARASAGQAARYASTLDGAAMPVTSCRQPFTGSCHSRRLPPERQLSSDCSS